MPTYRGKNKDSVITSITLPKDLHRQAQALARKRYTKLSPLIRTLLANELATNK